jgi:hypothetical protein
MYRFTSYTRVKADEESGVLVVLDDYESYGADVGQTGTLGAELVLRQGVSGSKVFLRECEGREGVTPFLVKVGQQAITV